MLWKISVATAIAFCISSGVNAFARDSLKFEKRSQFFVGGDDESLSVVAVCISNEDRLSVGINRCDAAPTPTGFAEIVSDDFPELHVDRIVPLLVSTQQSQNDMNGRNVARDNTHHCCDCVSLQRGGDPAPKEDLPSCSVLTQTASIWQEIDC